MRDFWKTLDEMVPRPQVSMPALSLRGVQQ